MFSHIVLTKHGKQIKICEVIGGMFNDLKNINDVRNEKSMLHNDVLLLKKKCSDYVQKLLYRWRINQMLIVLMFGCCDYIWFLLFSRYWSVVSETSAVVIEIHPRCLWKSLMIPLLRLLVNCVLKHVTQFFQSSLTAFFTHSSVSIILLTKVNVHIILHFLEYL